MINTIAKIISVAFHPVFMPVYGLFLYFTSGTYLQYLPAEVKKAVFLIVVLSTVVIPLCFFPLYYYSRLIRDIQVAANRERIIPLLFTGFLYFFAYILLVRIQVPALLKSFMLASAVTIVMALVVSYWFRISLHMIGTGGLLGALIGLAFRLDTSLTLAIMLVILLAGVVGTARLVLQKHRPAEVYSGFLLGLVSMSAGLLLLWRFHLPG